MELKKQGLKGEKQSVQTYTLLIRFVNTKRFKKMKKNYNLTSTRQTCIPLHEAS